MPNKQIVITRISVFTFHLISSLIRNIIKVNDGQNLNIDSGGSYKKNQCFIDFWIIPYFFNKKYCKKKLNTININLVIIITILRFYVVNSTIKILI